jgi:hypothetical protein
MAIFTAVGAFIVLNVGFYFLSGNYFEAHRQVVNGQSVPSYTPDQASHIRMVFGIVSGALIGVSFIATLQRRIVAHALAGLLGVGTFIGGIAAWAFHAPGALIATQLIIGLVMPVLAWFSYHRARAPWAFLVALCGVLALADLFGAPKIRMALDVSLWATMIVPGLYAIACVALAQLSADYLERDAAGAPAGSAPAR